MNPKMESLVSRSRTMVSKVHYSTKNAKYLKRSQKERGVEKKHRLNLQQDVRTRWNSVMSMVTRNNVLAEDLDEIYAGNMKKDHKKISTVRPLEDLLDPDDADAEAAVKNAVKKLADADPEKVLLSDQEWKELRMLEGLLQPSSMVCTILEGETLVTANKSYTLLAGLHAKMTTDSVRVPDKATAPQNGRHTERKYSDMKLNEMPQYLQDSHTELRSQIFDRFH